MARFGAFLVMLLALAPARGVLINFDDGVQGGIVGGFYAGLGVTFSNTQWDNWVDLNEAAVGVGGLKIVGIGPDYMPKVGTPIVGVFAMPVGAVSIRGTNVGMNGARIDVFDAPVGGTLLDFDQAFGTGVGAGHQPLLVTSSLGIRRFHLYQPLSLTIEGLLFDNLEFTPANVPPGDSPIPEPATLAMVVAGLAALRRRRR